MSAMEALGQALSRVAPHWRCECASLHGGHGHEPTDAILIALDSRDDTQGLAGVLDGADRLGVPRLMLSTESGTTRATGTLPLDASTERIAATLSGMLARQSEIDRLREQTRGAERLVGGLRGDLARVQDEMQLAAQVQREFLPKTLPELPRAHAAAMWRPASWVSGDIYDVRRIDEHHLGLFIADTVGHGVPAALMTMVLSRTLVSKEVSGSSYRILPPAESLARVNEELLKRESRSTRFATAVYAVLDLRTLRLRLASAGHPAPVVLRGDRAIEVLHVEGGVLGVFEEETWSEIEVDLSPGDRLLLHSDGLEAAVPEDPAARGAAEIDRHLDWFRAMLAVQEPAEIVRRIGERIDRSPPSATMLDDITMVALRAR
jgi:sigma-B regulation protein RsbU (phosphoserine phosphatase)